METPNKLQEIAFNDSLDIDFQDFINLYKRCTAKPYFFWFFILLLHQIIFHVAKRILQKEYKR